MRIKNAITVGLCLALVAFLTGCDSGGGNGGETTPETSASAPAETSAEPPAEPAEPPADTAKTICMASFTLGGPYFVGMENTVVKVGEAAGAKVVPATADGDAAKLLLGELHLLGRA